MFTVPTLPTDSLYKFCFVFGILLIIFSFYYSDSHLNRFNKNQVVYQIDSISTQQNQLLGKALTVGFIISGFNKRVGIEYHDNDSPRYTHNIKLKSKLKPVLLDTLYEQLSNITWSNDKIQNETMQNQINSLHRQAKNNIEPDKIYKIIEDVEDSILTQPNAHGWSEYQDFLDKHKPEKRLYMANFYCLLILGIALFAVGTWGWYVKIQKPQDRLLLMQIDQLKKQNEKLDAEYHDWLTDRRNKNKSS